MPIDRRGFMRVVAAVVGLLAARRSQAGRAEDWAWSSARAHLAASDDALVRAAPLLDRTPDWPAYLGAATQEATLVTLRGHGRTGRPLGSKTFVARLETMLGRRLGSGRPGRPRKAPEPANK